MSLLIESYGFLHKKQLSLHINLKWSVFKWLLLYQKFIKIVGVINLGISSRQSVIHEYQRIVEF